MSLFVILFAVALSATGATVVYDGKAFHRGAVPRMDWDSSYTYTLKRTLHMHRREVGYTVKNGLGQDVTVTKPFNFAKRNGRIVVKCPKYKIACEAGYSYKDYTGYLEIVLPWKDTSSKFVNPYSATRCRSPPRCIPSLSRRSLRKVSPPQHLDSRFTPKACKARCDNYMEGCSSYGCVHMYNSCKARCKNTNWRHFPKRNIYNLDEAEGDHSVGDSYWANQWLNNMDEAEGDHSVGDSYWACLLYTSPSPRDRQKSRMPSSA